ncbi:hypothetical protein HanIR_Chr14g0724081 [Helianthus annuus]|nr:hypothetical protein HanIR_Chr14g0724081 [Helianthus annuus]
MPVVANHFFKGEKPLDAIRNMNWGNDVRYINMSCIGVDEVSTRVIASDIDVAVRVGYKAARERWEMGEGVGKGVLEANEKVGKGERRSEKEIAFLDVVTRKHGEIGG